MVPVNFYLLRDRLRRRLLDQVESLATAWDPFTASWLGYALSVEGAPNNQPLAEIRIRMQRWLDEETVWEFQRNLGPIGATLWLWKEADQPVNSEIVKKLSERVQQLDADEKWSPLRNPEQVFLLALGFQLVKDDPGRDHLAKISRQEMQYGPLRRRILFAAALRELGEDIPCPQVDPQDEGDFIALVWWAERYGGNKSEQWDRFGSIQERIAFDNETESDAQRTLTLPEIAMLYEAIARETRHPDPMLLFNYFPLHDRIREVAQDYFRHGKYVTAIFEATKALNAKIQECSGVFDKNETELVQATMKQLDTPSKLRIRFNDTLSRDSGKSEQSGLALIFEGVFRAFRNPKGHELEDHPLVKITAIEALEQLIVISYLMKRLETAYTGQVS